MFTLIDQVSAHDGNRKLKIENLLLQAPTGSFVNQLLVPSARPPGRVQYRVLDWTCLRRSRRGCGLVKRQLAFLVSDSVVRRGSPFEGFYPHPFSSIPTVQGGHHTSGRIEADADAPAIPGPQEWRRCGRDTTISPPRADSVSLPLWTPVSSLTLLILSFHQSA